MNRIAPTGEPRVHAAAHPLRIEPLGITVDVAPGQTLLDAALRQGIYVPHACGHGLCGTCKVQVLEGEVDHGAANPFALMDVEREEGKTLACCATALSSCAIEAEVEDDPDVQVIPVRDFEAVVEHIEPLTPTIRGIHLKLQTPLHFQAGQYIQLQVPGVASTRAFSIANAPARVEHSGSIELHVRHVPGGLATTWLHEHCTVGQRLQLTGPYGRFFVRQSARKPLLFLAGGSGLSSPLSMVEDLLDSGYSLPITLVVGQRTRQELYHDELLLTLAQRHPQLRYVPTLSAEPEHSGWTGHRGAVHEVAKSLYDGNFAGHQAYLCGPPLMIEACLATLMQGRLYERDIYTERFLSAADVSQPRSAFFKRL